MRKPASALLALLLALPLGCVVGDAGEESAPPPRAPGHAAHGGSLVIDRERLVAWAADADNHAIHRLDLLSNAVTTTAIDGAPEQIALLDGERLAVTVRDRHRVEIFASDAAGALTEVGSAEVPADPFGIVVTAAHRILVTSGFSHAVTAIDDESLEVQWSVDVGREPRGIVVAADGARAFVTHVVGDAITVIELAVDLDPGGKAPTPRRSRVLGGLYRNRVDSALGAGTLHPQAALAYAAVISDSGARLFVPHVIEQNGSSTTRSIPGAYGGVPVDEETSFASVAVVKTKDERALGDVSGAGAPASVLDKSAFIATDPQVDFAVAPAAAPSRQARAAAVLGDRLLVASQGTNALYALDARALDPAMHVERTYAVGEGPKGVDVEPASRVAVVWSQLSHDFAIVALDSGAVERVVAASDPLAPEVAAGRRLFFSELDRRITRDGRSCGGCHPDGRDDGVVWKLGAGPRQTPTLVGRLDHGPYGWLGKHAQLEDNMAETIGRLGGTGLPDADLRRLAAFLRKGLVRPDRPESTESKDPLATRGRALFTSDQVGCSGCHKLDTEASDRALHVVGSRGVNDTTDGFRTPPLLFVGSTAPYFHDGRYATLEQLLTDNLDRMGQTTSLSPDDLKALAAFLRTL
jgi:DNA-binding beta-propeller fold protein YncE